jgi:hypothetical protein
MVDFIELKRKKHSWLSLIVVACCKSHNPTRGQDVTPQIITYLLPRTRNFIVSGRGKGGLVSTIFPQISSKRKPPKVTLWPSLFAQKPLWNKPNQVKPTLLSLLFGLDSVGVNATLVAPVDPF